MGMYCVSMNTESISKGQGLVWSPSTYLHTAWLVKDCLQLLFFFMNRPVTRRREEPEVAVWVWLSSDFVSLIHRLDLVFVVFFVVFFPFLSTTHLSHRSRCPSHMVLLSAGCFHTDRMRTNKKELCLDSAAEFEVLHLRAKAAPLQRLRRARLRAGGRNGWIVRGPTSPKIEECHPMQIIRQPVHCFFFFNLKQVIQVNDF